MLGCEWEWQGDGRYPFPRQKQNGGCCSRAAVACPGGASSGASTVELHQQCAGTELTCPPVTACGCGKANIAYMQPFHPAPIGSSNGLIQFWAVFSKNLNWGWLHRPLGNVGKLVSAWASSEWHLLTPKLWVRQMALSKQTFYCRFKHIETGNLSNLPQAGHTSNKLLAIILATSFPPPPSVGWGEKCSLAARLIHIMGTWSADALLLYRNYGSYIYIKNSTSPELSEPCTCIWKATKLTPSSRWEADGCGSWYLWATPAHLSLVSVVMAKQFWPLCSLSPFSGCSFTLLLAWSGLQPCLSQELSPLWPSSHLFWKICKEWQDIYGVFPCRGRFFWTLFPFVKSF